LGALAIGHVVGGVAAAQPSVDPLAGAGGAGDEIPAVLLPYESRPVRAVVVRPEEGTREIDPETQGLAANAVRLAAGAPFSSAAATEDVARLTRLGRFQRVDARVQLFDDGSVEVAFVVRMQPLITAVQSVGNRVFNDESITGEIDFLVGTPIDRTQLDRAARRIEARYRERGYFNAGVAIDEDALADGIVIFRVREGEATKVTEVRFEGNLSFTGDQLESAIQTQDSWILSPKPLRMEVVDDDVASLGQFYRDRGFLDVRVDRVVTPSPDASEAIVTFVVDEGPAYVLRSTKVIFIDGEAPANTPLGPDGQPLEPVSAEDRVGVLTVAQVEGLLVAKPGDVYSEAKLRRSVQAIEAAYGKLGYADVRVQRRELRDGTKPEVDALLVINQGRTFRTGEVFVQGNAHTQDKVVRRILLDVKPDRPLDRTAIQESERRLQRSGLFGQGTETKPGEPASITIQDEDPLNPGYRDVLVQVSETNTGSFQIGGAAGSDTGLVARISLNQANFDVSDTPDSWDEFVSGESFKGAGQQFGITLSPGDRASLYSISLTEPNIFDTDYSLGGSLSYRTRDYNDYTERRYGANVALGRRLGDRWRLSLPVGIENVELTSIEPDAPTDYFEVEDARLYYSVGVSLSRRTLDDQFNPSTGSITEVNVEQFFGEGTFNKINAGYARFFTLYEDPLNRKTTLEVKTRIGYIPQDEDDVPFYERLYQGGRNFRGFRLRTISPKGVRNDTGEVGNDPVGGRFLFFLGAEVKQPLFEDIVSGAVFIDSGTVTDEIALDPYRVSVGVGLRLNLPFLGQAPLAFDFGVPVLTDDGDRTQVFSFSLDVPFN
jgi:outer membrane protein insertion porin family